MSKVNIDICIFERMFHSKSASLYISCLQVSSKNTHLYLRSQTPCSVQANLPFIHLSYQPPACLSVVRYTHKYTHTVERERSCDRAFLWQAARDRHSHIKIPLLPFPSLLQHHLSSLRLILCLSDPSGCSSTSRREKINLATVISLLPLGGRKRCLCKASLA